MILDGVRKRGLESIFGFYRVGLERRDTHFVTPDAAPLGWRQADNIDIVPEQIARGMESLENLTVMKYSMIVSSAMEWVRNKGPNAYGDIVLATGRNRRARRAIRVLSVYSVAITMICVALFISTR
jgi:hypothetical protein